MSKQMWFVEAEMKPFLNWDMTFNNKQTVFRMSLHLFTHQDLISYYLTPITAAWPNSEELAITNSWFLSLKMSGQKRTKVKVEQKKMKENKNREKRAEGKGNHMK